MEDIFIGVDGGGTKSKLRIEDSQGRLLGQAVGGASNIRLSVDNAWHSIMSALTEALQQAKLDLSDQNYRFHIGMGLAGTEIPDVCEAFLQGQHPFTTLLLKSDAYAACLGAHEGADGAIIIIGTGVIGYQLQAGESLQVGGWGFPHGDEGSGAWLGLEAIRLMLKWLDGRVQSSLLLEAIYAHFNNDLPHFLCWVDKAKSTDFATIAPLVIEFVDKKDPLALALVKQAAAVIDDIGATMARKTQGPEKNLPCSLFGGIAPFIAPWLGEALRSRIVPRKRGATEGAVFMIRKQVLGRFY